MTNSRTAWLGLVLGTILVSGRKITKSIPSLILTSVFICLTSFVPYLRNYYKKIFEIAIPNQSWISVDQFNLTRLDIWQSALQNILKKPFFGSGSGSFPEIFLSETGIFKGHPHNIVLELMISYGIPAAFLITVTISIIFSVAFVKIFLDSNKKFNNYF